MVVRHVFFIIIFAASMLSARAQCLSAIDTIDQKQLKQLLLFSGAAYGIAQAGLYTVWYQQPSRSFHFFNDMPQWKQLDKAGHAYSVFHLSNTFTRAFRSTGLSAKKSTLYGGLTGFFLMLPVEIMDGYAQAYGASLGDVAANAAGTALFSGQMMLWHQIRIHPKFSFHRTTFPMLRPELLGSHWHEEILKDYNGQTYWWSFDLYSFQKPGTHFPRWLNIATGYGANNMVYARDQENEARGIQPYREYYIAFDLDLSHFKKSSDSLGNRCFNALIFAADMIHLPSPALSYREHHGFKFYPLFF